jgi:sugar lactone lactonase YvrE
LTAAAAGYNVRETHSLPNLSRFLKVQGKSLKSLVKVSALSLFLAAAVASAQTGPLANGYIYTYAGNGIQGYSGDGGAASTAELSWPRGVSLDAGGNLYIADTSNDRIRRVDAASGIVTTVVGGTQGSSGDGGPAISAELSYPEGVTSDAAGNLYIADTLNNRIRKVDAATDIITTVAGNGTGGFGGDGGLATNALLDVPAAVALDTSGDIYVADTGNNCIRRVDAITGIIITVAGDGNAGFSGDGGPATKAELTTPFGIAVDASGNLYIPGDLRIREVSAATAIITTIAGNGIQGYSGDGGPAVDAEFWDTEGVTVDTSGNLYIADTADGTIRRVSAATGIIITVAGDGVDGYGGDGGPTTSAELHYPEDAALDGAGNLYIADTWNNRVRVVRPNTPEITTNTTLTAVSTTLTVGQTLTLTATVTQASGGTPAGTVTFNNGTVSLGSATLNGSGVATLTFTPAVGNYSVTASYGGSSTDSPSRSTPPDLVTVNGIATTTSLSASAISLPVGQILTLTATVDAASGSTPTGTVTFLNGTTSLGSGSLNNSGVATLAITPSVGSYSIIASYGGSTTDDASSSTAVSVSVTSASNSPNIYTFAGDGVLGYNGDGELATSAELNGSVQMAMDTNGNVYLADGYNHRIRKVFASTGTIATVAGNGTSGYSGDGGPAIDAELENPNGVAIDAAGNIYISDSFFTIRKVDAATGIISTIVGDGVQYQGPVICGSGQAINVEIYSLTAIALDHAGNIYFAEGNDICKVEAATGIISRFAGDVGGGSGYSGDGGPATSAELNFPLAMTLDTSGNMYIADTDNQRVRRIDAVTGIITTVAGNGGGGPDGGYSGDGGPATSAELSDPEGVALDADENLFVSSVYTWRVTDGSRVRRVDARTGVITTYAGNGNMGFSGDGGPANDAELSGPTGLMVDANNNLYIADANANNRIRIVGQKPVYLGATTTTTLSASSDPSAFGSTVTFTATVAGSANTLTGTVSFYDGTTLLATETLASETATYATSTLSIGSHNITAVYSGGGGINGSTSNVVVESIVPIDFSISASPGSQTVYTGQPAAYNVTIAPGIGFDWQVALSCTELPANTTCTFSPATVNGGAWSSKLAVQTSAPGPAATASVLSNKLRVTALAGLFLLIIPGRLRRYRRGWPLFLAIFALLATGTAITGCSSPGPLTGGTPVGAQTITVTGIATNGAQTLTHATNVTLNVKSLF